jgi:beta-glucosidase
MRAASPTTESRIDQLLRELSPEQKVRLVSGANFWRTKEVPDIGLGSVVFSDGPSGVRGETWDERSPSLCVPSPTALAATWDERLVSDVVSLLAADARRRGVHVVLAPTLNLHRSPLGGRHFECFSEDPLLTGSIGVAYVSGLQRHGIGACVKHYVGNDSENDRFDVDVRVDERTLREVYLAPFERAVAADVWSVMAAYNSVNGATMTEHPLLTEPLKGEWGFDGLVVSDWKAVRSTINAAHAAVDLAMPGPSKVWGAPLAKAVHTGLVSEAAIDDKVRRLLRLAFKVGAMEEAASTRPPVATKQARALIRDAATKGMVLLRNAEGVLPLPRSGLSRLAVIGPSASNPQIQGGGSATVIPEHEVSPLAAIRAAFGDARTVYEPGLPPLEDLPPVPIRLLRNPETGAPGIRVRFLGKNSREVRHEDRFAGQLVWEGKALEGVSVVELHTQVRAERDGVHQLGVTGWDRYRYPGTYRLSVDDTVLIDEVVDASPEPPLDGFEPVLPSTGEVKLAAGEEVSVVLSHRLAPGAARVLLTLGMTEPFPPEAEAMGAAVTAAREADAAVVVVGTTLRSECEGYDRASLALPGQQAALVRAIARVNERTVVVVNAGAPVDLSWHEDVPAVLVVWFPGQEFGHALADVLTGAAEPGGRLPTTWPVRQRDVPVLSTSPVDGALPYSEGLHLGYRAWARGTAEPAYCFGHGLGYTTWEYRQLDLPEEVSCGTETTVRVRLANTGGRDGRDVVQIYLRRADSRIERPDLWLAGFRPVILRSGEEVDVEVTVPARAFQHWCVRTGQWETESGAFTVLAGSSSARLPLVGTIAVGDHDSAVGIQEV